MDDRFIGIISGSGFYDINIEDEQKKIHETRYGNADLRIGSRKGMKIAFISRHGKDHEKLPNHINYRANLLALKEIGCTEIIGTTVCGVLKPSIPLGRLIVFDDLFFPDNRLPNGEACSIYTELGEKSRGHYIFGSPFNEAMRSYLLDEDTLEGTYAHVSGPRFNSKPEINFFSRYADFLSQTAGSEIVLAGELEIPYSLIGFSVDYANGVSEKPTPINVLQDNLRKSKSSFIEKIDNYISDSSLPVYDGFIYRFS